ncbi:MAG: helix-turn-helix domain-containing protein [Lachnospiraceae bacterium]|nr:helix-turn-helix domain-containing protein [Lachnospiraceae bacterium]
MYRVCIADDEIYVQKSIIQRIANCQIEFEIAGTAVNGLEAQMIYEEQRPDLFFVDINMPMIDGLDFIERVKKQDSDTKTRFVIISGYDDFAYMKRAIRLGVVNYIKKTILQQEFNEMIREVYQQLETDRTKAGQEEKTDVWLWSDFLESGIKDVFCGTCLLVRKQQAVRETGIFLKTLKKRTGIPSHDVFTEDGGMADQKSDWQAVAFGNEVPDILLLFRENQIMNGKEICQIGESENFREASQIIYFSGKYQNPEELIARFEDMLNLRFYHVDERVMRLREMENQKLSISYSAFSAALENARENKYKDCISSVLNRVFADVRYAHLLKQVYQSMVMVMANKYMKYGLPLPAQIRQELFPFAVSAYKTRKDLMKGLVDYAAELNQKMLLISSRCDLVDRTVQYMERNYREEISLKNLADEFFVVPTYLARRFKEKKNCTVMQYLEDIRLRKSKELLETSDYSILEIAQMVGYNDQNYFARSFRKVYGVSPREYRNSCG